MNKVAIVVAALGVVAATVLLLRRGDEVAPPAAAARPEPPPTQPAPAAPEAAPIPPTAEPVVGKPAAENPDWLAYPDGTAFPPLNGVSKAPKLTWHRMVPFSKVLRIERDAHGRDWYVHENGARSTTYVDGTGKTIADIMMEAPAAAAIDEGSPKKQ